MCDATVFHVSKDTEPEKIRDLYDDLSRNGKYDVDINPDTTYPALKTTVSAFVKTVGDADKNIRIIDLGAGTGHAAVELKKHGFENIDGLDLSPGMLEIAKKKIAYRNYFCTALTEQRLDIATGQYDAAICVGTINSGYIKAKAFDEMTRLIKPGGWLVFTIRQCIYDEDEFGYAEKIGRLVEEGKWQAIEKVDADYLVTDVDRAKECFVLSYRIVKNQ